MVFLEILSVDPVEGLEVALHVDQEDRDVNEISPRSTAGFKYRLDVRENTMDLCFKIEGNEVSVVVDFQARDGAVVWTSAG